MTITPLGDAVYEVESESNNTYLIDLDTGRCSCPDHTFRGVRCKHLRRLAIEITDGRVPPPGTLVADCAVCGEELFVPETTRGPSYCSEHRLAPGTAVRDRETGDRLLVVHSSDRRADEIRIGDSAYTVATHPTNRTYDPADRVVGAVYPQSIELTALGPDPESLRVYSFPRSRLERID